MLKEHDRIINKRNFKTKCNGKKNRRNPETDLIWKAKEKENNSRLTTTTTKMTEKCTLNLKHVHYYYYCNVNAASLQVVLPSIFHCRRKNKIHTEKYEKYFLLLLLLQSLFGILQLDVRCICTFLSIAWRIYGKKKSLNMQFAIDNIELQNTIHNTRNRIVLEINRLNSQLSSQSSIEFQMKQ